MSLRRALNAAFPFLCLFLVVVFFSLLRTPEGESAGKYFFTLDNFKFVAMQAVPLAIASIGMTLVFVLGGIDLSVGSVVALSCVVGAGVLHRGYSPFLAVIASAFAGVVVGRLNGTFVAVLRLAPCLVTLAALFAVRGAAQWLADERVFSAPPTWISETMRPLPANEMIASFPVLKWVYVAPGVWIAILLAGTMIVVIRRTVFGRHLYAIGSSEETAALCGIRVERVKIAAYTVAGLFFGLAGLFQMARLHQGDPATGAGMELDAAGAVLLGGANLQGGRGSVLGSAIGALTIATLRNGAGQAGWATCMQGIAVGALVLATLALDRFRHREMAGTGGRR